NIPPLSQITSGAMSQATPAFSFSLPANCQSVSGGPPVPTVSIDKSKYPAPTALAPINSPEVEDWMGELDGIQIPDIPLTINEATCAGNTAAAADTSRCWWTCGGCTRDTDIVTCPNKGDWGVTFDDGPSPYTPIIMNYLQQHNLHATFFCVGSSMYWEPSMVVQEYCSGHQVAPHTWFHPPLTTMTNRQIVAELGWSRKMIKDLLGVTPKYFRAPYGDIDDRVRAIALAMNLKPVQWTRDPRTLAQFDTNDWKIPGGIVTGAQAYQQFQTILQNASTLNTGFIVLEHDLYPQTVDLAAGYTLDLAQKFQPPYQLKSVIECQHLDIKEAYIETASNNT
ncbi:carbohydrate esterase family 4 protein, partial [Hysterangium stoloniferum]